ncbi:MAG: thermonuclease family protein, partial [Rubrivivax sp.]
MTQAAPSAGRPSTASSTPTTLRGTVRRLGLVGVAATCLWAVAGAAAAAPGAASLTGQITRIVDGDSVYFRAAPDAPPLELRLAGIDAPEGCQPGGAEARTALAGFVLGKTVTAMTDGHDAYGRTLARLSVGELEVNKRMVIEGQAWSIRTKWDRGPYVAQEKVAKALHRGVHASGEAELPALFRKRHGPCKSAPP